MDYEIVERSSQTVGLTIVRFIVHFLDSITREV